MYWHGILSVNSFPLHICVYNLYETFPYIRIQIVVYGNIHGLKQKYYNTYFWYYKAPRKKKNDIYFYTFILFLYVTLSLLFTTTVNNKLHVGKVVCIQHMPHVKNIFVFTLIQKLVVVFILNVS